MATLGDSLVEACGKAQSEILLVAPFVKAHVLERLLKGLSSDISLGVITRWQPEEIAAGVSDVGCWEIVRERPGSRFHLLDVLHAKYYRADERAFLGSANLTGRALGWVYPSNLELLVDVDPIPSFERQLWAESYPVDAELASVMRKAADALLEELAPTPEAPSGDEEIAVASSRWVPGLRHPTDLYLAYEGRLDELASSSRGAALRDLEALRVPRGLSSSAFMMVVESRILSLALVRALDHFLERPRRFGEVAQWLEKEVAVADGKAAWQALMRWLLFFLPDRYERSTPGYSEMFARNTT